MKILDEKIEETIRLKSEGFSNQHIADKLGVGVTRIKDYISEYKKRENIYNQDHLEDKYGLNDDFFHLIKPKSILDVCCGQRKFWADYKKFGCNVVSNDCMEDKRAQPDKLMTFKAHQLLEAYKLANTQFDIVDVDTYGNPADCLEAAVVVAKKGLIITFGEFKRLRYRFKNVGQKYFKEKYGMKMSIEDITINDMADMIINLSKNKFKVWKIGDWRYCDRIYFKTR